jgi:hypothetical protein
LLHFLAPVHPIGNWREVVYSPFASTTLFRPLCLAV